MPYEILQQGIGWVVVKAGTHHIVGRHKTRAEAMAQMRQLHGDIADVKARYEIQPVDGVHHVLRKPDNVMMGSHSTRAQAEAHLRALDEGTVSTTTTQVDGPKNESSAKHDDVVRQVNDVWEIRDWFTGETVAALADENAAHTVCDIMLSTGQLTDADFSAAEMKRMGSVGTAFKKDDGTYAYPTPNLSYFGKAQQAFGRSVGKERERLKAYLIRRGKALGASKEEIARISAYSSS